MAIKYEKNEQGENINTYTHEQMLDIVSTSVWSEPFNLV